MEAAATDGLDFASAFVDAYDRERAESIDYARDPLRWSRDVVGAHLWSKQCAVLESVRDCRRTAVHSCHNVGKTFTAAMAAAWWISAHPPGEAFVVTTAPTAAQVKALLWREIGRIHGRAGLIGRVNLTEWYIPNAAGGEEMVAFGRTTSKDNEAAFQGVHARRVLVVIDEASGVHHKIWEAAESIASNRHSRILAIGNPDLPDSPLADACKPDSVWNVIHIGLEHTPAITGERVPDDLLDCLISPEWAEDRRRAWGEESALYQAKVLGQFPAGDTDPWRVIPETAAAACRYIEPPYDPEAVRWAGVDVGGGSDRTVLVERVGMRTGRIVEYTDADPMSAVGRAVNTLRSWGTERANVDTVGIGWAFAGRLREVLDEQTRDDGAAPVDIVGVNFGGKSSSRDRANVRADAWWNGRELSTAGAWSLAALDDDQIAELTMPRYLIDSRGKIQIEPKKDVRNRLGRSPDVADAVLLAFYDRGGPLEMSDSRQTFAGADLEGGSTRPGYRSMFGGPTLPGLPVSLPTRLVGR